MGIICGKDRFEAGSERERDDEIGCGTDAVEMMVMELWSHLRWAYNRLSLKIFF